MQPDNIEIIVNLAHDLFNQTSIHEVIDLDRESARQFLHQNYKQANIIDVEGYLDIIGELPDASCGRQAG